MKLVCKLPQEFLFSFTIACSFEFGFSSLSCLYSRWFIIDLWFGAVAKRGNKSQFHIKNLQIQNNFLTNQYFGVNKSLFGTLFDLISRITIYTLKVLFKYKHTQQLPCSRYNLLTYTHHLLFSKHNPIEYLLNPY